MPISTHDKRSKYLQLADQLRAQIQDGRLTPGARLPSYSEIEAQFGFSQNTVEKTHAILEQEGLIQRVQGHGVFVAEPASTKKATGYIGYIDGYFHYTQNTLYYNTLLNGVREGVQQNDRQLILIDSAENFQDWSQLDGLILCETGHFADFVIKHIKMALPAGLPCANTLVPLPGVSTVLADDMDGIRQIVRHLANLGHRRIGYLSRISEPHPEKSPLIPIRYQAYLQALLENRLEFQQEMLFSLPLETFPDNYWVNHEEYGYRGMQEWLKGGWFDIRCTALMTQNDLMAIGAIQALREAGLNVPGDVSVVGFDGVEIFHLAPYQLTTVNVPVYEIGRTAVKVLLEHIENPTQKPADIILPVRLASGETAAGVANKSAAAAAC